MAETTDVMLSQTTMSTVTSSAAMPEEDITSTFLATATYNNASNVVTTFSVTVTSQSTTIPLPSNLPAGADSSLPG